jgi:hypothetical protein
MVGHEYAATPHSLAHRSLFRILNLFSVRYSHANMSLQTSKNIILIWQNTIGTTMGFK